MLLPKNVTVLLIFMLVAGILFPASAHAYIDPGTGSFVIQGIIAAVVGAGFAAKVYWHRILSAITGKKPQEEDDDDDQ